MKKIIYRFFSYLVDIIILAIVLTLFVTFIPIFKNKEIDNINIQYSTEIKEYELLKPKLDELLEDKVLDEEEFNNIKEDYQNIYIYFEDIIGKEVESDSVKENFINEFNESIKLKEYEVQKLSLNKNILELILTILYFGLIQYLLKGQSIGKKIFRLYVVNDSGDVPSLINFIFRSIFVSTVVIAIMNSVLALSLDFNTFESIYKYTSALSSFYIIVFIFVPLMFREDQKGCHDIILKTRIKLLNKDLTEYTKTVFGDYDEKTTN